MTETEVEPNVKNIESFEPDEFRSARLNSQLIQLKLRCIRTTR